MPMGALISASLSPQLEVTFAGGEGSWLQEGVQAPHVCRRRLLTGWLSSCWGASSTRVAIGSRKGGIQSLLLYSGIEEILDKAAIGHEDEVNGIYCLCLAGIGRRS